MLGYEPGAPCFAMKPGVSSRFGRRAVMAQRRPSLPRVVRRAREATKRCPAGFCIHQYWSFHKWEYPNSWMLYFMENPTHMDDLEEYVLENNTP